MIYEYPKEFIVPVVYVEELLQKRSKEIRELNLLDMHEELLKKQDQEAMYNYNMAQQISDNENIKSILNEIDEDYAISETLSI